MSTTGSEWVLQHTARPGVEVLELNKPDRLNALDGTMVEDLLRRLTVLDEDPACRAIVLAGRGRAFCAGLDLNGYGDEGVEAERGRVVSGLERQKHLARLVQQMRAQRQPIVAAVDGAAAGAGLALVCASDIRVASSRAVFIASFIKAGFSGCDLGISWTLPRLVGAGMAHEMMLTGRSVTASEGADRGLISRVLDPDDLMEEALSIARSIVDNPPLAVELTKEGMWKALESPGFDLAVEFENRQQLVSWFAEDQAEAVAAFLEKRAPQWTGR